MTLNLLLFEWCHLRKGVFVILYHFSIIVNIFIVIFLKPSTCVGSMFSPQPHISVHTIQWSDRMQEHMLELHFPSHLHSANGIKSLLIGGLSEETGYHVVSFRIHSNFVGSCRFIWLKIEYSHSTICKNADGVGGSFLFQLNIFFTK